MSAAVMQTVPNYHGALAYWDEFTGQCEHLVQAINEVIAHHNVAESDRVQWQPGSFNASIVRASIPSTEVKLSLEFEHWGPRISGSVRGEQADDLHFYPEEFEFAVATDGDDLPVAVTTEGRSLSPHEFAKYVLQHFRRSYPGLTLPAPETPIA